MIVAVCADKGVVGATTVATALAVVWPGRKVLVETDPSGADLPFRLRHSDSGSLLRPEPSIGSLAAAARLGDRLDLDGCAQPSVLGVPVIPGFASADRFAPVRGWWPQVGQALAGWPGTAVVDLGRWLPGHAAAPVAQAASVVLLVAGADLGGLFRLRERVMALAQAVGRPGQDRSPVMVAVTGPGKTRGKALQDTAALLASIGSPAPVAGFVPTDPRGAADLWAGPVTRRLAGSELLRATRTLAEEILTVRPDLWTPTTPPPVGAESVSPGGGLVSVPGAAAAAPGADALTGPGSVRG